MQLIQPINKETCRSYIGQHVCAMLHDGTQVHGVISNVTDDGLEFNGPIGAAELRSSNPLKTKKQLKNQPKKTSKGQSKGKTSAFGPGFGAPYGGYGYGRSFALSWAAISLLFLLPFFFI